MSIRRRTAVRIALLPATIYLVLALVACSAWERRTFQTLSSSKAALNEAAADYEARTLPHTQAVHDALETAEKLHNTAVDSFRAYKQAKQDLANGTPSVDLATAKSRVNLALAAALAAIQDLSQFRNSVGVTVQPLAAPAPVAP